jgi:hypothetical protein
MREQQATSYQKDVDKVENQSPIKPDTSFFNSTSHLRILPLDNHLRLNTTEVICGLHVFP